MKLEDLEKQIENHLEQFEQAVDLPLFNEETGETMKFVRDGIIDVTEYTKAPVKILWVLKEANSIGDNSIGDMRRDLNILYDDDNNMPTDWRRTWGAVAFAIYGVFEKINYGQIPQMNGNAREVVKHMSKIAHINVKKYGGGSRANDKPIQDFYDKYRHFIHYQIEIINPDVLIFGGTFKFFSDIYFTGKEQIQEDPKIYRYRNKLLIDTYHPNARVNQQAYCDGIINAINKYSER